MQNRTHIKHLKAFLGEQVPMRSIIVFSDRCTLKSVQIKSNDISVINRYSVAPVVSGICNQIPAALLSESDIADIYNKLYPYTQVDAMAKAQHIANIHNNLNPQPIQQTPPTDVPVPQNEIIQTPVTETIQTETVIQAQAETVEPTTDSEPPITTEAESSIQTVTEPQPLKCPKCSGNLVLRTATRGANAGNQFYGCSNYPKCKYIQNVVIIW